MKRRQLISMMLILTMLLLPALHAAGSALNQQLQPILDRPKLELKIQRPPVVTAAPRFPKPEEGTGAPRALPGGFPAPMQTPIPDSSVPLSERLAEMKSLLLKDMLVSERLRLDMQGIRELLKRLLPDVSAPDKFSWREFGRVHAPDAGAALLYTGSGADIRIAGSVPHGQVLLRFAYTGTDWVYIADGYLPAEATGGARVKPLFIPAANVIIPKNEFEEDIAGITWSPNGWAVNVTGGQIPIYDGPGSQYNVITHVGTGTSLWDSAYWPKDPNWVVIFDKEFIGLGYGNGQAFMEAKYYTTQRP